MCIRDRHRAILDHVQLYLAFLAFFDLGSSGSSGSSLTFSFLSFLVSVFLSFLESVLFSFLAPVRLPELDFGATAGLMVLTQAQAEVFVHECNAVAQLVIKSLSWLELSSG